MRIASCKDDEMRKHVCYYICEGSKVTSPFLHASTSGTHAVQMKTHGEDRRGEVGTKVMRIDLANIGDWWTFSENNVINMSNEKAQKAYFNLGMDGYCTLISCATTSRRWCTVLYATTVL